MAVKVVDTGSRWVQMHNHSVAFDSDVGSADRVERVGEVVLLER